MTWIEALANAFIFVGAVVAFIAMVAWTVYEIERVRWHMRALVLVFWILLFATFIYAITQPT